jgi:hypothetical protein
MMFESNLSTDGRTFLSIAWLKITLNYPFWSILSIRAVRIFGTSTIFVELKLDAVWVFLETILLMYSILASYYGLLFSVYEFPCSVYVV